MKSGKVSQQSIARALGVSQTLVSLVLNGKRENVSAESYERIWKYALKMGYRPKGMQPGVNHLAPRNVGFVLRAGVRLHTQSNYFSHVQHGLHAGLLEQGYHSVFLGSEDDLGLRSAQETLKQHPLFGVAIFGQVSERFLRTVRAVQSNIVAISISYPGLCHSVMPHESQSLELLVQHLRGLGHQQFAWLGGDKGLHYNLRRRRALEDSLAQAGLKIEPRFCVDVETGDRLAGWKAAEMLLNRVTRGRHPTAWVCANGLLARGVISRLLHDGWRVPEEVSVVAVDATRVCVEEHPQITGAHADPEKMGRTAAELLLRQREPGNETLVDVILPAHLTVRETSGPAAHG